MQFLRDTIAPSLDAQAEVLEIGASAMTIKRLLPAGAFGRAQFICVDVRTLPCHAELQPPHRFIEMDAMTLRFDAARFDMIICNNTLPYISEPDRALAEIRRCLRVDGLALLNTQRRCGPTRSLRDPRHPHPEFDAAWLAENGDAWLFGDDFTDRLEAAGLEVRIETRFTDIDSATAIFYGLRPPHEMLLGFRDGAALRRFHRAPAAPK